MVGTEVSKEVVDKVLEAIELAKATGKLKKGTNEVTKAVERGTAKLVAIAKDISPPEVVMHLPVLSEEKGIICVEVPNKEELGAAAGIDVPTASVAIVQEGESKKVIAELQGIIGVKKSEPEAEKKEAEKEAKAEKEAEIKKEAGKEKPAPKEEKKK